MLLILIIRELHRETSILRWKSADNWSAYAENYIKLLLKFRNVW